MIQRSALVTTLIVVSVSVHPLRGQNPHVLVIAGIGGEPQYREQFQEWSGDFVTAATEKFGIPAQDIIYLGEDVDADPRIRDRSTSENVERAFSELASSSAPDDPIFVVLIGHGSFSSGESRFNLPGPDLTANDFALLLDQLGERPITFANLASASGEFVKALSGEGRTVVTATRSGREGNLAVFGGYFIRAFTGETADLDKDGRVSVWEAFEFARIEVAREFATSNLIVTEHALLDDNGDGEGSSELGDALDGALARTTFLAVDPTLAAARATDDPALRALLEHKLELEGRIEELRALRGQIDQDRYDRELEDLLVELALANRAIQAQESGGN